jgi:hypothetical protein
LDLFLASRAEDETFDNLVEDFSKLLEAPSEDEYRRIELTPEYTTFMMKYTQFCEGTRSGSH